MSVAQTIHFECSWSEARETRHVVNSRNTSEPYSSEGWESGMNTSTSKYLRSPSHLLSSGMTRKNQNGVGEEHANFRTLDLF